MESPLLPRALTGWQTEPHLLSGKLSCGHSFGVGMTLFAVALDTFSYYSVSVVFSEEQEWVEVESSDFVPIQHKNMGSCIPNQHLCF